MELPFGVFTWRLRDATTQNLADATSTIQAEHLWRAWPRRCRRVSTEVMLDGEAHFSFGNRYNGTSDLQLERMNVYFNEVNNKEKAVC